MTPEQKLEAAVFISGGYEVYPCHQGTWVVQQIKTDPGRIWGRMGFTNFEDMTAWLTAAHRRLAIGIDQGDS